MSGVSTTDVETAQCEQTSSQQVVISAGFGNGKPGGKQDKLVRLTMIQKAQALKYYCETVPKPSYVQVAAW